MPRRRQPDLHQLGPRTIHSASLHLVVEAPIAAPPQHRLRRLTGVTVLLVCAGVIAYFLTNSPSLPVIGAGARSPQLWLSHFSAVQHEPLQGYTLVEYDEGTIADLTVVAGKSRLNLTLRKQHGLWREVG